MKGIVVLLTVLMITATASFAADVDGAKIYKSKCQSCHGKKGEGNAIVGKALKIPAEKLPLAPMATKSDEEAMKIIVEGVDKMPGYKEKLSEDEMKAVLAYCRVLVPKKAE